MACRHCPSGVAMLGDRGTSWTMATTQI
jgi:hypothetical protein